TFLHSGLRRERAGGPDGTREVREFLGKPVAATSGGGQPVDQGPQVVERGVLVRRRRQDGAQRGGCDGVAEPQRFDGRVADQRVQLEGRQIAPRQVPFAGAVESGLVL